MSNSYLGENLIFIISQPRSGSTLLQRILAGHPDIESSAETWLMLHPVFGNREHGIETAYGANWALLARNDFLENYTDGMSVYDEAVRAWAKTFYDAALEHSGGKIFIDKTPRYAMIIPELLQLFPKARFVFLLRNPLAVLASTLNSFVKDKLNILDEFRPDLLEAPEQILAGISQLGDKAVVVRYEDLVRDPEAQVEELCRRLNIDFTESMLDYSNTPEAKGFMTDRIGIQQRVRPVADSVDKWKAMLENPQQLLFAREYLKALGKDTVNELGYSYAELQIELAATKLSERGLFPWHLSINPGTELSMRDRYSIRRWQRRSEEGALVGLLGAFGDLLKKIGRNIKEALKTAR